MQQDRRQERLSACGLISVPSLGHFMRRKIRGAICPNQTCVGFLVPALDPGAQILKGAPVKTWKLACPFCHEYFEISDQKLLLREVSAEWLKRRYPPRGSYGRFTDG